MDGNISQGTLFSCTGKTALVTGASSGLGAHFAKTLALAGAKVALAARRRERLNDVRSSLVGLGATTMPVVMDVTDHSSVAHAVQEACEAIGPISILINNAGVASTGAALDVSDEDWSHVLETNLSGAWMVAQETAKTMVSAGGGSIVNIASVLGARGLAKTPAYCAAKGGLVNLTRALAVEWAKENIRVNALCPGYIETDLNADFLAGRGGERLLAGIPQRRFGTVEDLDGPLLLLASDAGSYMTGATLFADGGQTARL